MGIITTNSLTDANSAHFSYVFCTKYYYRHLRQWLISVEKINAW